MVINFIDCEIGSEIRVQVIGKIVVVIVTKERNY